MSKIDKLRQLADQIEGQPQAREQIAEGFRMLADFFDQMLMAMTGGITEAEALEMMEAMRKQMQGCTDCASEQGQALHPADNPEAGAEPRKLTAEESNAIGQAMAGADMVDTAGGQV